MTEKAVLNRPSDAYLNELEFVFSELEDNVALSMSYVRRVLRLTPNILGDKFDGISQSTLLKYMQVSYSGRCPQHVLAAFSWVTMMPMAMFYHGPQLHRYYSGMNETSIKAIIEAARLPLDQFLSVLDIIIRVLTDKNREEHLAYRKTQQAVQALSYENMYPPQTLDIDAFAEDYYYSLAVVFKRLRVNSGFDAELMARVLGISVGQYEQLENERKVVSIGASLGARTILGFQLSGHTQFTSEMRVFPQFHLLRNAQQARDNLIVDVYRRLTSEQQLLVSELISSVSSLYR
ncbi:helix-turn-helix domain-containing protein [Thaumasiovibrio subtropicus]|uniref:helix-turn-helix domain-containing protein n=1 Tax=Thaumasiovibrio subtropicus TaxID=1891207 RepID=UPI000B35183D|nr:helix-turn-helix domain-containing protein [Thaumasiovibrio subtropicus]